jgi:hypothetical protein
MPVQKEEPLKDFPDAKGMRDWLDGEIENVMKAAELRLKAASDMVAKYTAAKYTAGEISSEQAAKLSYEYESRWGDALPGVIRAKGMSDEAILARMDEVQQQGFAGKVIDRRNRIAEL